MQILSYTTQELQETGHRQSGEYTLDAAKLKSDRSSVADDSASPQSKQQGKSTKIAKSWQQENEYYSVRIMFLN